MFGYTCLPHSYTRRIHLLRTRKGGVRTGSLGYDSTTVRRTSGVGRGGGKGPGCGFKFAGSRTRSHIFSGFAALKTIRSRVLNYGNYHGQVCDN